ncbi:MAG: hypothetical protein RLZZ609_1614 [Cyanobacteriota bacterium]|jgi:predicted metal-dependent hydrolase
MTMAFLPEPLLNDARYQCAVDLFNRQQWYAAHDAFEELWHDAQGSLRPLLQGIIQISVAEYHLECGNLRGSTLLMAEGLNHLDSADPDDVDFNINNLKNAVARRLSALQSGTSIDDQPLPCLR